MTKSVARQGSQLSPGGRTHSTSGNATTSRSSASCCVCVSVEGPTSPAQSTSFQRVLPLGQGSPEKGTEARKQLPVSYLPKPAVGVAAVGDFESGDTWHATAGMLWLPEVSSDRGDVAFGITTGLLGACADVTESTSAALSICGAAQVGATHTAVLKLEPTDPGEKLWLAVASGPRLSVQPVGSLAFELGGELVVPFVRQEYRVQGRQDAVFRQPPVAGLVFVGVGLRIP